MKILWVLMMLCILAIPLESETLRNNRDWIPIYLEDFENEAEDWEYYDATSNSDWIEFWHLSEEGAFSGYSWWMGDEEIGGYTNNRYLILDTPELVLAEENPELRFNLSLCCEPLGSTREYDSWDGANVRISTDGGETWVVLAGAPAYNGTSLYSFGYVFEEGEDIPGWCGNTEWVTWSAVTFNLSEYSGQSVKLRFAFASDVAYSTIDDPDMFGMRIDDIEVDTIEGLFLSDGEGAAGDEEMVAGYGNNVIGNLWHIYVDTSAPSPDHAMGCFADSLNTYFPDMNNYLISPVIYLPENGIFRWDVNFKMLLENDNLFPDTDYMLVQYQTQIPGENWSYWQNASYWSSWMYESFYPEWTLFSDTWMIDDLTDYAGRNIRIRFGLQSNDNNEPVPGGIMLDDFCIYEQYYAGPPPENLTAAVNDFMQVELSWAAIQGINSLEGYNIWRSDTSGENYEMIGTVDLINNPCYTDFNPDIYWNYYLVTGIYDGENGQESNEASVYIVSEDDLDLGYDDGSCEMGLNVGIANYMGVRFNPSYPYPYYRQLHHLSIYIETLNTGQFVFRIFDEENGLPSERLAQFNVTGIDLVQGWNIIDIPEEHWEDLYFYEGSFYITIFEMGNLSAIGVDTDSYGHSWTCDSENGWEEYTEGNIMIHAILTGGHDGIADGEIAPLPLLNVYPNPFNPQTAIEYLIEKDSGVIISIYNIKGQIVEVLMNEQKMAGRHQVIWNTNDIAGGIYLLIYKTDFHQEAKKLIYLK